MEETPIPQGTEGDAGLLYDSNVFVNCPFDDQYWPVLRALLFAIVFLGYRPRLALESSDGGVPRIEKITRLIAQSKYGIHDLSRLQAESIGEYYRLNMPFELGLDFGHKTYSPSGTEKKLLILAKERHQYQRALSDLAGCDIKHHSNDPIEVIRAVRDWFRETVERGPLPGPTGIWNRFNDFMYDLHLKCTKRGFSEDDFTRLSFREYVDYAVEWRTAGVASKEG